VIMALMKIVTKIVMMMKLKGQMAKLKRRN
jgi:hypothetical protein